MRLFQYIVALFALSSAGGAAALPRVLIIGDSVYQQPAAETAKELKDQVEVVRAALEPGEICNTTTALEKIDQWLGEEKWDLIHFNFGLGDLVHRAPGMKAFRTFPKPAGGIRATQPQQYEKNLIELVARLKATGASLVWASTTPIRHSATNVFEVGSEIEYNTIAAKVMTAHNVEINDMHAYVLTLIDMKKPAPHGFDPFFFDKKTIHEPIVTKIRSHLGIPQTYPDTK